MPDFSKNALPKDIELIWYTSGWKVLPLAVNRVARRVASGGHNIPEDIIRRRYERGRNNFIELYSPIADYWIVYDNTGASRNVIAEKTPSRQITVYQPLIWQQITQESL